MSVLENVSCVLSLLDTVLVETEVDAHEGNCLSQPECPQKDAVGCNACQLVAIYGSQQPREIRPVSK